MSSSFTPRVLLLMVAVAGMTVAARAANIVYHVDAAIPPQYRGEEDFVHFTLYGEASGTPQDAISINNFQTDGVNYNFDPGVGTTTGTFPGNVTLTDDDATSNFSVYN